MPSIEDLIQVGFTPIQAKLLGGFTAINTTDISNTTTETSIASFEIPAQYLGLKRGFRVTTRGLVANTTGANNGVTLRYYVGATSFIDDTLLSFPTATLKLLYSDWICQNRGATNDQYNAYEARNCTFGGTIATGTPKMWISTTTTDTTKAQTIKVTATLTAASASLVWTTYGVFLEYL